MSDEVWKPIEGFEGMYEVSNKGRVKSLFRHTSYKNQFGTITILPIKEKLLKCNPCNVDYPRVRLLKDGVTTEIHVHRLVAKAFLDNPDNHNYVNHLDNNKLNNNVENLEWCSQSRNCHHAFDIGANHHGIKHWLSKLSEKQVREIRYRLKTENISQRKLAKEYNVSSTTIRMIAIGKTWRRLSD